METKPAGRALGWVLTSTMLLSAGVALYKQRSQPPANRATETFASWYDTHSSQFKAGTGFTDLRFMKAHNPTPDERNTLEKVILSETSGLIEIVSSTFFSGPGFYRTALSDAAVKDYEERLNNELGSLCSYAGIVYAPRIECRLLTPQATLSTPKGHTLPIYLVGNRIECAEGRFNVRTTRGSENIAARVGIVSPISGEIRGQMFVGLDSGNIAVLTSMDPVVAQCGSDAIESYTTPIAEAVHYALNPVSESLLGERMRQEWIAAGKPTSLGTPELRQKTVQWTREVILWEEGLTHGLLVAWLKENAPRLGFSYESIDKYCSYMQREPDRYQYISRITALISQHGVKHVVNEFNRDAAALFNP